MILKGNKVVIEKGIEAGEEVVTSGQNKLQNGTTVKINNNVVLKASKTTTLMWDPNG